MIEDFVIVDELSRMIVKFFNDYECLFGFDILYNCFEEICKVIEKDCE